MSDAPPRSPPSGPDRVRLLAATARPAGWARWLPGLQTLRHYESAWLRHDLVAGLALTAVLVPVGIAYAVASGVPAVCGLCATIFGLLAYALFGPSRVLVLGPDSSLVVLVLGVVLPLSAGDPQRAMAVAGMMAVVSGGLCALAGVARLGFVTQLLSKPIRYGYMNGIALTVLVSQMPAQFGFSVGAEGLLDVARAFGSGVAAGRTNWTSLAIGMGTLATMWVLGRSKQLPGRVLIAVAGATAIVAALDLAPRAGVSVVGSLPQGLPAFAFPWLSPDDTVPVLLGGLAVAPVSFAHTERALARLRRAPVLPSTPIRRWSAWVRPTWRPDCSRASRSARVHRARRSPRPRAPARNWPAWWARSVSPCW